LDSPAGVGFSYSKNKSKYATGDLKTASDTHAFLLKVHLRKKTLPFEIELALTLEHVGSQES